MQTKEIYAIVLLLLLGGMAGAQTSGFGLGLIVGEPTGLTIKAWTSSNYAVNGAAAWSFRDGEALHLHADYVFHNFNLIHPKVGKMAFYYGVGGRFKNTERNRFGVRVPVGLNYMLAHDPLDLFVELVPMLELVPETEFLINAAIGIRYFF